MGATVLPESIFSVDDDTNQPSLNKKNKTMTTTKGVGDDSGVYDYSSRIPMATLPKCLTRLPTTCTSPIIVHNDDEDEDKVRNNTVEGKQEEQEQQQEQSQSSGLSILREALTLSEKQGIDDDDDDDDDEALILSAIRLLNQQPGSSFEQQQNTTRMQ